MEWHFYLMVLMYVTAGVFHFITPKAYLKIMPPYFPKHKNLIFLSGLAELILGLGLLFKETKILSIYAIVLMLLIFLPVHVYMIKEDPKKIGVPRWFSIMRFPLQFVLIWWALFYL